MNKYWLFFVALLGVMFWSCKEDQPKEVLPTIALTAPAADATVDLATVSNFNFTWTVEGTITGGYTLLLSQSAELTSPKTYTSSATSLDITAADLNAVLSEFDVADGATGKIYWSVKPTLTEVNANLPLARALNVKRLLAPPEATGLPRFAVLSDTHFGGGDAEVRVARALKNLLNNGPYDALFVVGDCVDTGLAEQYDALLSVFNNPANVPADLPVYYLMGNHDNTPANGKQLFVDKLHQPLHQYIVIKGYPFITISETGTGENDYDREAQTFLSDNMEKAAREHPGKPIFVFVHVPPLNTCYGSSTSDGWGTDVLLPILNKYPQAFVFAGHSHWPIGDPRSIHQGNFTTVNDGSTWFSEIEIGTVDAGWHPENYDKVTEGLRVQILDNGNVELERRDTWRNEEIAPKWVIEAPHDGSRFTYKDRNGLPAPAFVAGATVKTTTDSESVRFTFPQASDNDVVHHYLIEMLDNTDVVATYNIFSQFYINSEMPSTLTATIPRLRLPDGNSLKGQVTAIDSYNNKSAPITGEPFTLAFVPAEIKASWLFDDETDLAKATVGKALTLIKTGGVIASVEGPTATNKAIRLPVGSHLIAEHSLVAIGGEAKVNDYTLLIDFKIPAAGSWQALTQTNLANDDDADLFINKSGQIGRGQVGNGGIGYSATNIEANKWYRLVVSSKLGVYYNLYLNGTLLHATNENKDSRQSLDPAGVILFGDNDGEDNLIDVSAVSFWNKPLTEAEIAALGGF